MFVPPLAIDHEVSLSLMTLLHGFHLRLRHLFFCVRSPLNQWFNGVFQLNKRRFTYSVAPALSSPIVTLAFSDRSPRSPHQIFYEPNSLLIHNTHSTVNLSSRSHSLFIYTIASSNCQSFSLSQSLILLLSSSTSSAGATYSLSQSQLKPVQYTKWVTFCKATSPKWPWTSF